MSKKISILDLFPMLHPWYRTGPPIYIRKCCYYDVHDANGTLIDVLNVIQAKELMSEIESLDDKEWFSSFIHNGNTIRKLPITLGGEVDD